MRARAVRLRSSCFMLLALLACPRGAEAATRTITGVVRNESGSGVANVDVDLIVFCSGQNVFLVNDKTLSNGTFSIVVNEGTYDVRFTPPSGGTLAASEIEDLVINQNLNLGVTTLHPGRLVSGAVRNGLGFGLAGVDLDFIDAATGRKIYLPNDLTASGGGYSVRVLPGTYDVEFRPGATTAYLTGLRKGLIVSSDVSGLTDVLRLGTKVTGTVKNGSGNGVAGADLDLTSTCTGETIQTAHDNTDSSGNFTVYVPAGEYTAHVTPPRCTALGAAKVGATMISSATSLGTLTLPSGVVVTGRVLDSTALPVPAVDLDFFDSSTGASRATARDNTDSAGNFTVYVAAGVYDVNFNPPASTDLLVTRIDSVTTSGATGLGDITLEAGLPVSGSVLDEGGSGVLNVDIDAIDAASGAPVRLAHDGTAADGSYEVTVPAGAYDLRFTPPECTGLAADQIRNLDVTSPLALPAVVLSPGKHVSGLVKGPGSTAVVDADLDVSVAGGGAKLFTPGDNTDGAGHYDVLVPPGAYDIDYIPPPGSTLRPARRLVVLVVADTALPDTILPQGVVVSGLVRSSVTGLQVADVDLDFVVPGGGSTLFTPRDRTGADGAYAVVVDAGTWDILYTPPEASGLAPRWKRGVTVSGDLFLAEVSLLPLTTPVVSSITPGSGTTAGGQAVTINGSGFQADCVLKIGGVTAAITSAPTATALTALTPPHPAGQVDLRVTNPGNLTGVRPAGYTFQEPAVPINLLVTRSGNDIVLSWASTGQSTYTIFLGGLPTGFGDSSIAGRTSATTFTDAGGATRPGVQYYVVD